MKSADIKEVLFQEEVEMMLTSLVRSAEEDTVKYKKKVKLDKYISCFVFQVDEAEQDTLLEAQFGNFEGGQKSKHNFPVYMNILDNIFKFQVQDK